MELNRADIGGRYRKLLAPGDSKGGEFVVFRVQFDESAGSIYEP